MSVPIRRWGALAIVCVLVSATARAAEPTSQPITTRPHSTLHALCVAVDDYPDAHVGALPSATTQSTRLADLLEKRFGADDVRQLTGSKATRTGIIRAIKTLADKQVVGKSDGVIIHIASRALAIYQDGKKVAYLLGQDARAEAGTVDAQPVIETLLPLDELMTAAAGIPAQNVLVVIDAQFGGYGFNELPEPADALADSYPVALILGLQGSGTLAARGATGKLTTSLLSALGGSTKTTDAGELATTLSRDVPLKYVPGKSALRLQPTSAPAVVKPAETPPADRPGMVRVVMETTKGNIVLELDPARAPITVENFLTYTDEGFYEGTLFHRVIRGFMIQGGGFDANMARKTTHPPIRNESSNGLKNLRGTIAMARLPEPDTATSQFFINLVNNQPLDYPNRGGYCVFGHVVEGMDVVDAIAAVPTGAKRDFEGRMMQDVPLQDVIILAVRRQ